MVFIEPKDNPNLDKSKVSNYTIYDGIHPTDATSAELADMLLTSGSSATVAAVAFFSVGS